MSITISKTKYLTAKSDQFIRRFNFADESDVEVLCRAFRKVSVSDVQLTAVGFKATEKAQVFCYALGADSLPKPTPTELLAMEGNSERIINHFTPLHTVHVPFPTGVSGQLIPYRFDASPPVLFFGSHTKFEEWRFYVKVSFNIIVEGGGNLNSSPPARMLLHNASLPEADDEVTDADDSDATAAVAS
jgi:hypothetical protein